jgi:hypothetical protein
VLALIVADVMRPPSITTSFPISPSGTPQPRYSPSFHDLGRRGAHRDGNLHLCSMTGTAAGFQAVALQSANARLAREVAVTFGVTAAATAFAPRAAGDAGEAVGEGSLTEFAPATGAAALGCGTRAAGPRLRRARNRSAADLVRTYPAGRPPSPPRSLTPPSCSRPSCSPPFSITNMDFHFALPAALGMNSTSEPFAVNASPAVPPAFGYSFGILSGGCPPFSTVYPRISSRDLPRFTP